MIFVLICATLATSSPLQEKSAPIDTVLVRTMDLTGDRIPERLQLRIAARSFYSPFEWVLSIHSGSKQIYHFESDGISLEERFREQVISEHVSYDSLKSRFFFQDFCEFRSGTGLPDFNAPVFVDSAYTSGSVYWTARQSIKRLGLGEPSLTKAVNALAHRIRNNRAVMFDHSDGNVDVIQPMSYVPEVRAFVPVYSW